MNARAVVPDFELPATRNQRFRLSAFKGHPFVLYFFFEQLEHVREPFPP